MDIIDITHKHGAEMHLLGLKHSLEMAKIFRDFSDKPIEALIEHLEKKVAEAENEA